MGALASIGRQLGVAGGVGGVSFLLHGQPVVAGIAALSALVWQNTKAPEASLAERYGTSRIPTSPRRPKRKVYGGERNWDYWGLFGGVQAFSGDVSDPVPPYPFIHNNRPATVMDICAWVSMGVCHGFQGLRIDGRFVKFVRLDRRNYPRVDQANPAYGVENTQDEYYQKIVVYEYFGSSEVPETLLRAYPNQIDKSYYDVNQSWFHVVLIDNDDVTFTRVPRIEFVHGGVSVLNPANPNGNKIFTNNIGAVLLDICATMVDGIGIDDLDLRSFQDVYNRALVQSPNDMSLVDSLSHIKLGEGLNSAQYSNFPATSKRATFTGVVEQDGSDLSEILDYFDWKTQGTHFWNNGKLTVRIGDNVPIDHPSRPLLHLTDDDIALDDAGRPQLEPRALVRDRYNVVRGIVYSNAHNFEPIEFVVKDRDVISKDGAERVHDLGEVTYCTDLMEVVRTANLMLSRQRNSTVIPDYRVRGTIEALGLLPGDSLLLSSDYLKLSEAPCKVMLPSKLDNNVVRLTLLHEPRNTFRDDYNPPDATRVQLSLPQPAYPENIVIDTERNLSTGINTTVVTFRNRIFYPKTRLRWKLKSDTDWAGTREWVNERSSSREYKQTLVALFDDDTDYVIQLQNENRNGRTSDWSGNVDYNPGIDRVKPPAPLGVSAFGVVRGVFVSRTEVDRSVVKDYERTEVTFTYTPSSGTEKSVVKSMPGSDQIFEFADIGLNDTIAVSIVVKDVDRAGNKSDGVTVSATTLSAVEVAGSFDNFPIGGRFGWSNYQQRTPQESPADPWDPLSWYIYNESPPTPSAAGPPLTRAIFEALGTAGAGSDLITVNPGTIGGANFADFCDANSERSSTKQFPKFANTLFRAWVSDNYWAIYRISYMQFATADNTVDGTIYTIWFRPVLVHSHFKTPYPTFGSATGQPTLYLDFQLARGARGPEGPKGNPGNPGRRGIQGVPGEDGDEWRFVIQDTATAGTPTITNKTDRTVDPGVPTGWKKFNSGDADLQIDNVLKPFRWEAASQKVNGRWSDWKIILLSVGGERVQAWFTFVARHKFVQWRRWKEYQITNNVESVTDYTDADVPSRVTGTEARAKALDALRWVDGSGPQSKTPPVPGKQFGNSSSVTVPQKVIRGAREATTPADTITTLSPLFNMDMRYRNSESEGWHLAPANDWNFGVIDAALAEAASQRHFEEWCTHRYYDSETLGRYQDFVTPEFCRELDHEAFVPVGGLRGQALFHDATSTLWKFIELADIAGFTGTGGLWTQIRAEVTQLLADVATLKAAPDPVAPITIAFSNITYKSFRATVSGGGTGHYALRYKKQTDTAWITLASQVASSFDVPVSPRTIDANTTYDVQAAVGDATFSPTHTTTTRSKTAPATPTHLSRRWSVVNTRTNEGNLTVSFRSGTDGKNVTWDSITSYTAQLRNESGTNVLYEQTLGGAQSAVTFIRVGTTKVYSFRLTANNDVGSSTPAELTINPPSSGGGGDQ